MGKGDGEVEEGDSASSEEEELETSALYKQEDDVQLVLQASGEKARERFENEVRNICATIQLVVVARQDTIAKLERAADYLDSVWLRCRVRSPTFYACPLRCMRRHDLTNKKALFDTRRIIFLNYSQNFA